MSRRTRSQSISDDLAFPIRVKIVVPPNGLIGVRPSIFDWLQENVDRACYALHPAQGLASQVSGIHFTSISDAKRFVDAFPQIELADGTRSPGYYSPHKRAD